MAKRNDFIHMLRGIAALSVVCFHAFKFVRVPTPAIEAIRTVTQHGYLGVPVFFVISGFVISNSLRNSWVTRKFAGNYILRRELRLAPTYWCAIIFSVCLDIGIHWMLHEPLNIPSWQVLAAHAVYLQNIFGLGNLSMGLWTLCLEVQFYLSMLLLLTFAQRTRASFAIIVLILGAASLGFALDGDSDDPHVLTNAYKSLPPNFSMFAIGILAWLTSVGRLSWKWWLAAQAVIVSRMAVWFEPELLAAWLTGIAVTLQATGRLRIPSIPVFMFLGTISYSVYLIHPPADRMFILGLNRLTGTQYGDSLVVRLLSIGVGILAGAVMYRLVEKPSMRLAEKMKAPSKTGPAAVSGHASDPVTVESVP